MRIICPSGLIFEARKLQGAELETLAIGADTKKQGDAVARILQACHVSTEDPGPYSFTGGTSFDWKRILSGDTLAALIQHRIAVLGPVYSYPMACEQCGERNEIEARIDELELLPLSAESAERVRAGRPFETTMLDGRKVTYDLATTMTEEYLQDQLKQMKRRPEWQGHRATNIDQLAARLRTVENLMNARGTENVSNQFVKRLEFLLSCDLDFIYDLQKKMDESDCGVETGVEFTCTECKWEQTRDFPLGRGFLTPPKASKKTKTQMDKEKAESDEPST